MRPCISTESALQQAPERTVRCGNTELRVIVLPPRFNIVGKEIVTVQDFVPRAVAEHEQGKGFSRDQVRAAVYGATSAPPWRNLFDGASVPPSALHQHLKTASGAALDSLLTAIKNVAVVMSPDGEQIYATTAVKEMVKFVGQLVRENTLDAASEHLFLSILRRHDRYLASFKGPSVVLGRISNP